LADKDGTLEGRHAASLLEAAIKGAIPGGGSAEETKQP
jgi:hypothetical protein